MTDYSSYYMRLLRTYNATTPWWLSGGIAPANCIAAYQPKGAASLAASYSNLANPGTYYAAPGTAPTWDAVNGWIFVAGNSTYLTTTIHASNVMTMNGTWIIRYASLGYNTAYRIAGYGDGGGIYAFSLRNRSPLLSYPLNWSSDVNSGIDFGGAHVLAIAKNTAYKDATPVFTMTQSSASLGNLYIGCINLAGTPSNFSTLNWLASAYYNIELNATQIAALTTAMNL